MTAGPVTVVTNVARPQSVRATGPVQNAAITTSHGASSAIAVKPPRPVAAAVAAVAEDTSAETTKAEIAEVEAVVEDTSAETTKAEIAEVEAVVEDTSVAKAAEADTSVVMTEAEIAEAATTEVAKAVIEGPRAAIVVRNPVIRANPAIGDPRAARTPTRVTPSERAEI